MSDEIEARVDRVVSRRDFLGRVAATSAALAVAERPVSPVSSQRPTELPSPIHGPVSIRLIEEGAILKEDFEAAHPNLERWRIRHDTRDRCTIVQARGRLNITARGDVQHEGFWGLVTAKAKDVVLVADMDIRSTGPSPHRLALHLCGGDGRRSPDHWVEVQMVSLDGEARFAPGVSGPLGVNRRQDESITLPHLPNQGFTCRIELDGQTNLAELSVQTANGWQRVCKPIELVLRTVHAEVKLHRQWRRTDWMGEGKDTISHAWFDNVRMYPRPATHHVGVIVARADAAPLFVRQVGPSGRGPAEIADPDGGVRPLHDLEVQLWTEDGKQLVSAVRSGAFGFYLLPLQDAPWDVYPVAAEIRLAMDGQPLGDPVVIRRNELDGLYPDQVYDLLVQ